MLVLSRFVGQSFVIEPSGIRVTVVGVSMGGGIRIGIDAPQSQTILREELVGNYQRMKRETSAMEARKNVRKAKD